MKQNHLHILLALGALCLAQTETQAEFSPVVLRKISEKLITTVHAEEVNKDQQAQQGTPGENTATEKQQEKQAQGSQTAMYQKFAQDGALEIGYGRQGWQPAWWSNGYREGWRWFLMKEPVYLWIKRDEKTSETEAGAFAFGRHEILLKKSLLAKLRDWWNRLDNATAVSADEIISWEQFNQQYPDIAQHFAHKKQQIEHEGFSILGNFGVLQYEPKSESETGGEHMSDVVTIWKPSKEVLNAYMQNGTLVDQEKLPEPESELSLEAIEPSETSKHETSSRVLVHSEGVKEWDLVVAHLAANRDTTGVKRARLKEELGRQKKALLLKTKNK